MAGKKFQARKVMFVQGVISALSKHLENRSNGPFTLEYHSPEPGHPEGYVFKKDRTNAEGKFVPLVEFFPACQVAFIEFDSPDAGGLLDRSETMDAADVACDVADLDDAVKAIGAMIKEANPDDFKANGHPKPQAMAKHLKRRGVTTEYTEKAYAEYLKRRG